MNNRKLPFFMPATFAILDPKGFIGLQERGIITTSVSLMLLIILPAVILAFFVARKYRAGNEKAQYEPNRKQNPKIVLLFWLLPAVIVFMLATITWKGTHELDPWKPLDSNIKPITIQVVALQWKWLFIYPEQNIATVNFIQFPAQTPINFELTADAPMNSFWIPQLGGQMYAMAGMSTKLHLMAAAPGDFAGSAAEINGSGFAGMKFTARASSLPDFDAWVQSVKNSPEVLDLKKYNKLAIPSENDPPAFYSSTAMDLYNTIIMKFTMPEMK